LIGISDIEKLTLSGSRSINRLPEFLAEIFQELQRLTGWSFTVLMGGPTPALSGGKLDISSFHVGESKMGNLFSKAYPEFNDGIMKPYAEFLKRVYRKCEFECLPST
jgi:hypothetical protein